MVVSVFFFFQAEDGIRDLTVTGVQTCALPISVRGASAPRGRHARSGIPMPDVRPGRGAAHEPHGDPTGRVPGREDRRSEEHTSELQSQSNLVCRLLLDKKKNGTTT